jgi:hypothetical protein
MNEASKRDRFVTIWTGDGPLVKEVMRDGSLRVHEGRTAVARRSAHFAPIIDPNTPIHLEIGGGYTRVGTVEQAYLDAMGSGAGAFSIGVDKGEAGGDVSVRSLPEFIARAEASMAKMLRQSQTQLTRDYAAAASCSVADARGPTPNLRQVVAGAVYDFAQHLTAGDPDSIGKVAGACETFLRARGCSSGEPAREWSQLVDSAHFAHRFQESETYQGVLRHAISQAARDQGLNDKASEQIADRVAEAFFQKG